MKLINHSQGEDFAACCYAFKKLVDDHPILSKNESFPFFRTKSAIEKVVNTIIDVIEKIIMSFSFPKISFEQQLSFIQRCDEIYTELKQVIITQLKNKNKLNGKLLEFGNRFSTLLKASVVCLWCGEFREKSDVNLNYLGCYQDYLSVGLDCPSNYTILRAEAMNVIFSYIAAYPRSTILPLVNPISPTFACSTCNIEMINLAGI